MSHGFSELIAAKIRCVDRLVLPKFIKLYSETLLSLNPLLSLDNSLVMRLSVAVGAFIEAGWDYSGVGLITNCYLEGAPRTP